MLKTVKVKIEKDKIYPILDIVRSGVLDDKIYFDSSEKQLIGLVVGVKLVDLFYSDPNLEFCR